jgi:hypothetical protein
MHQMSLPGVYESPMLATTEKCFTNALMAKEAELRAGLAELRRVHRSEQALATQSASDVRSQLAGFWEAVRAKDKHIQQTNSKLLEHLFACLCLCCISSHCSSCNVLSCLRCLASCFFSSAANSRFTVLRVRCSGVCTYTLSWCVALMIFCCKQRDATLATLPFKVHSLSRFAPLSVFCCPPFQVAAIVVV